MSGGHFNLDQYKISQIADDIEHIIENNDNCARDRYGDEIGCFFKENTLDEFRTAVQKLRETFIYVQRIDWLMSGDDNEKSFHKNLKFKLEELNKNDQSDPNISKI